MDVACVREVDGEAVEDSEQKTLASSIASPEHDVAVYSTWDIDVDLYIVWRALIKHFVENGNQFVICCATFSFLGAGG